MTFKQRKRGRVLKTCPSGKRRFRDNVSALIALLGIRGLTNAVLEVYPQFDWEEISCYYRNLESNVLGDQ